MINLRELGIPRGRDGPSYYFNLKLIRREMAAFRIEIQNRQETSV